MTKLPKFRLTIPILKPKENNNYYTTLKMVKLPKFVPTIPIYETQTEQHLLYDFKDGKITEIQTDDTHF